MQFGLFLKVGIQGVGVLGCERSPTLWQGIGLNMEDALQWWRQEFTKVHPVCVPDWLLDWCGCLGHDSRKV